MGPHLSSVQNLGWLSYITDYSTQLYRDYNKPFYKEYKEDTVGTCDHLNKLDE